MSKSESPGITYTEGMRLKCEVCQREIVIVKEGKGTINCCGKPMKQAE